MYVGLHQQHGECMPDYSSGSTITVITPDEQIRFFIPSLKIKNVHELFPQRFTFIFPDERHTMGLSSAGSPIPLCLYHSLCLSLLQMSGTVGESVLLDAV